MADLPDAMHTSNTGRSAALVWIGTDFIQYVACATGKETKGSMVTAHRSFRVAILPLTFHSCMPIASKLRGSFREMQSL